MASNSQVKLSSFFKKPKQATPPATAPPPEDVIVLDGDDGEEEAVTMKEVDAMDCEMPQDPSWYEDWTPLSPGTSQKSKSAWSALFAPVEPPRCIVHDEPTKQYRVNKPGPNKGKTFFVCSR